MKALLIQIRENPVVQKEEYDSFLKYSGLKTSELHTLNVFEKNLSTINSKDYDGFFIGGASTANVLEVDEYPFVEDMITFVKELVRNKIPTLASCFGFQVAALALSSEVIDDRLNYEMGTVPISLSRNAINDRILCDTPSEFMAVSVHQQKVVNLPDNCIELGRTKDCLHIFKVIDSPFWAFQFHPEVDRETLVSRLEIYKTRYTSGNSQYQHVIENAVETIESNKIIKKFTERILKK